MSLSSVQDAREAISRQQWTPADFKCSACSKLLFNPVVLNCGHAVCGPTCRPQTNATSDCACPRCEATIIGSPSVCTQVGTRCYNPAIPHCLCCTTQSMHHECMPRDAVAAEFALMHRVCCLQLSISSCIAHFTVESNQFSVMTSHAG